MLEVVKGRILSEKFREVKEMSNNYNFFRKWASSLTEKLGTAKEETEEISASEKELTKIVTEHLESNFRWINVNIEAENFTLLDNEIEE